MQKLFTLPANFVRYLSREPSLLPGNYFACSDPEEGKVGSGGGTANLLYRAFLDRKDPGSRPGSAPDFWAWYRSDKRILIHAGGESRRLPSYASTGKLLVPVPVFRWERGQKIDQTLLDLQLPLYEKIMQRAPSGLKTLLASGDVLIRCDELPPIPDCDVVCLGLWGDTELASRHGVFVCSMDDPSKLEFMVQKPSIAEIQALATGHHYLVDTGVWLLNEKAVSVLFGKCGWNEKKQQFPDDRIKFYDLYSEFGPSLGSKPEKKDSQINALSVSILPLPSGRFYHFGATSDLITSLSNLQNLVTDQREILHRKIKPNPDIFIQNSITTIALNSLHQRIWIDNSHIPATWSLEQGHIITGVPENKWKISLPAGICLDILPVEKDKWCIRTYGINDPFKGPIGEKGTSWQNEPALNWFKGRKIDLKSAGIPAGTDIHFAQLFPVLSKKEMEEGLLSWLVNRDPRVVNKYRDLWLKLPKLSSAQLNGSIDFNRYFGQKNRFLYDRLPVMAANYRQSVFYQLDLNDLAAKYAGAALQLPEPLPEDAPVMTRIHDQMFRSKIMDQAGKKGSVYSDKAFSLLSEGIMSVIRNKTVTPEITIFPDQIVWGRSPVRWDLAGGWTDTPPYCITHGGKVVNMAIEINGQPPLQIFLKPTTEPKIILRSIDMGEREDIEDYEQLIRTSKVGSAFAITKTALNLAGFTPLFSSGKFRNLKTQLKELGGGIEISLLSAVPKGSGLGTSSILAATVMGTLSDFYNLKWDRNDIAFRTLVLEQLLTTGGGWQDQFGGILHGIKLLESNPGFEQVPAVKWAPEYIFNVPENRMQVLLYYTGITRIAKNILTEIVRSMFLNGSPHLSILSEMKHHAVNTYEAIQQNDWNRMAACINYSWELNQQLDKGTNTPGIQSILDKVKDYLLACKLLGAGGGGYMLMIAKDPEASAHIRQALIASPPNPRARFVDWAISSTGLKVTRS